LESDGRSPLDAARKLVPQIRSAADEIHAHRELPRALFEAMADAGLFHMAIPRAIGGGEIDLPTYIQVIEEIGKADASTGWCLNQGAIFGSTTMSPTDTTRNTGNQTVGLIKISESAITVHMSVTKHALMISLPILTVFSPVSTSTA